MTFLNRLKQAAGQLADGASRQAKILQLQSKMGGVETEIERNYTEAGKQARQLFRQKKLVDADVEVFVHRIEDLEEELQSLREEVQELQQPHEAQDEWASEAPQPTEPQAVSATEPAQPEPVAETEPEPEPQPEMALCPDCGSRVAEDAQFCQQCGSKLVG